LWSESCLRLTLAQCVRGTTHILSDANRKRRRLPYFRSRIYRRSTPTEIMHISRLSLAMTHQ